LNRPYSEKSENTEIGEQDEEKEQIETERNTGLHQNLANITAFIGNHDNDTPERGNHATTIMQQKVPPGNNENPPMRKPPTFIELSEKEINGLYEKGAFEFVDASEIPEGTRIFGSRFVDEIKHPGTDKAYEKSRLAIQAYNDPGKDLILTQSPTVQRVSQRLILVLAVTLRDKNNKTPTLYLRDISQAYVQSRTPLARDFYTKPPPELGLPLNTILKLVRPLYGVPEAGNHWFQTYHRYHREKLKMEQSTYDPCLLFTKEDNIGIIGLQTDDTLLLADKDFATEEERELLKVGFLTKEREELTTTNPIKFNGGQLTLQGNSLTLTQGQHCQNLRAVSLETADLTSARGVVRKQIPTRGQYVAQRARGAYVATVCQPEATFNLLTAAQVTEPTSDDIKKLNKLLERQKENSLRGLTFVPLKVGVTPKVRVTPKIGETPNSEVPLRLVIFTDSSFANNADYSSQIGYIIALADNEDNANILHWSSTKCKRVTRSTLASKLYGMVNGFDIGAAIKKTIENITKIDNLPLLLCTDSKCLYECLVKLGTTHEKRLMVDIMCLRQSYERREINEVIWIDGDSNPANAMTKSQPCQALRDLINSNRIDLRATGWVERN
jgi:hypothetical protein